MNLLIVIITWLCIQSIDCTSDPSLLLYLQRDGSNTGPTAIEVHTDSKVGDLVDGINVIYGQDIFYAGQQLNDPEQLLSDIGTGAQSILTISNHIDYYKLTRALFSSEQLANRKFHEMIFDFPIENATDVMLSSERSLCQQMPWMFYCDDQGRISKITLDNKYLLEFNLEPLKAFHSSLQLLDLCDNLLHSLDLSPLRVMSKLKRLYLSQNKISYLDLSPLIECPELAEVHTFGNQRSCRYNLTGENELKAKGVKICK